MTAPIMGRSLAPSGACSKVIGSRRIGSLVRGVPFEEHLDHRMRHKFCQTADLLDVGIGEFVRFVAENLAAARDRDALAGDVVIAFHSRSTSNPHNWIRAMDIALRCGRLADIECRSAARPAVVETAVRRGHGDSVSGAPHRAMRRGCHDDTSETIAEYGRRQMAVNVSCSAAIT
ncbi:MAG TPA: hypothetical protein VFZ98_11410 [Vicinamibacterales bacterium]